ncbi:MAG TPA: hypothetical protein VMZ28_21215 [Kofleriaceae bacterium]|nr:hypothetical protein [Kofleriaceae bacterium]
MRHPYKLRLRDAPDAPRRAAVERRLGDALSAGDLGRFGGRAGGWRWRGAVATLTIECGLDEAAHEPMQAVLEAVHAEVPLEAVDRGGGWAPFSPAGAASEPAELEMVDTDEPGPAPPAPPAPEVKARYVFDDYVVPAPGGRHLAFVRDRGRCHFQTLHLVGAGGGSRAIEIPILTDYPLLRFSDDGARLLVGGTTDVLLIALDTGAVTRLLHLPDEAGIDVCWLAPDRVAAASSRKLTLIPLADPASAHVIPCAGGRLVRAVLGGRVLIAGSDEGTLAFAVDGDTVTPIGASWRSLAEVWERGGRVFAQQAHGGICELLGLRAAIE